MERFTNKDNKNPKIDPVYKLPNCLHKNNPGSINFLKSFWYKFLIVSCIFFDKVQNFPSFSFISLIISIEISLSILKISERLLL